MSDQRLKIVELYNSLQGEGAHMGLPCFFVRTAGCDLRCTWCDTPGALEASAGRWVEFDEILSAIPPHVRLVQLTGGEPLLQGQRLFDLCERLAAPPLARKILLETGGHRSLREVPPYVHIVMDWKLPGSGEARHDFAANIQFLKRTDEIKFVIADRGDFETALEAVRAHRLEDVCDLLFSPVWGRVSLRELADWMLEGQVRGRLQTQLHKHIWGPAATGV